MDFSNGSVGRPYISPQITAVNLLTLERAPEQGVPAWPATASTPEIKAAFRKLWTNFVASKQSVYDRLSYMASLRETDGQYAHFGLGLVLGNGETAELLRATHETAFLEWLGLPLAEQAITLRSWLREHGELIADLKGSKALAFERLIPSRASMRERKLFEADLDALLEALSIADHAATRDEVPLLLRLILGTAQ